MRSLYEIDNDILSCVDTETGEIVDEAKLEALEMERDKKIEAVILWRKDLLAEAKAVREEAQNLSKRVKSCENKAEARRFLTDRVEHKPENFANARDGRNYLEKAIAKHATRVVSQAKETSKNRISKKVLSTIEVQDLEGITL